MKQPKPKHRTATPDVLSTAECARRTGLTVRTLRVYEREGLIVPSRGPNGWRVYGEREVRRLNAIITLKSLGLTLREIRGVLSAPAAPSLQRILELQLKAWLAREAAAGQAIKLVRSALTRLATNKALDIDELCELTRSNEMSVPHKSLRDLVGAAITPDERSEYLGWWRARPREEAQSMQAFGAAQLPLFRALEKLRLEGADPGSPKVQRILARHRALMLKHRVREQTVALMEWNPGITRKWMDVGEQFRNQTLANDPQAPGPFGPALYRFFIAGSRASAPAKALKPIMEVAQALTKRKLAPASKEGQALGKRMNSVCRRFRLGDPAVYALSMAFILKTESDSDGQPLDPGWQAPYRFLAEAVRGLSKSGDS